MKYSTIPCSEIPEIDVLEDPYISSSVHWCFSDYRVCRGLTRFVFILGSEILGALDIIAVYVSIGKQSINSFLKRLLVKQKQWPGAQHKHCVSMWQLLRDTCCYLWPLPFDWEPPSNFCVSAAPVTVRALLDLLRRATHSYLLPKVF